MTVPPEPERYRFPEATDRDRSRSGVGALGGVWLRERVLSHTR